MPFACCGCAGDLEGTFGMDFGRALPSRIYTHTRTQRYTHVHASTERERETHMHQHIQSHASCPRNFVRIMPDAACFVLHQWHEFWTRNLTPFFLQYHPSPLESSFAIYAKYKLFKIGSHLTRDRISLDQFPRSNDLFPSRTKGIPSFETLSNYSNIETLKHENEGNVSFPKIRKKIRIRKEKDLKMR